MRRITMLLNRLANKLAFSAAVSMMCVIAAGCADDFEQVELNEGASLRDAVVNNSDLDIFAAALEKTGLVNAFTQPSSAPYTLFAPNDAAFLTFLQGVYASAPPANEDEAIAKIQGITAATTTPLTLAALVSRLNYHIVSSEISGSSLVGAQTFTTINGARLSLSIVGSDILINGNTGSSGSKVVATDDGSQNGIVYVIDKVLAAPTTASLLSPFGLSINYSTAPATVTGGSETGGDANGTDFDILAYAIRKAGLVPTLLPNQSILPDFTIFAPTDNAFRAFLGDAAPASAGVENAAIQSVKAMSDQAVADLLKYHVLNGRYLAADLSDGRVLTTLSTQTVSVSLSGTTITLQDGNAAADPTITASNNALASGIIHSINGVLRPN